MGLAPTRPLPVGQWIGSMEDLGAQLPLPEPRLEAHVGGGVQDGAAGLAGGSFLNGGPPCPFEGQSSEGASEACWEGYVAEVFPSPSPV